MRREGFEFALSPPRVLYKQDEDGTKLEPIGKKKIKKNDFFGIKINWFFKIEEVTIDVDDQYANKMIEKLSNKNFRKKIY